jgi:hypothetical protein
LQFAGRTRSKDGEGACVRKSSTSERIERIYREAGFDDPDDLVRHATVKYLNELEADHRVEERLVRDTFDFVVRRSRVGPTQIRLAPAKASPVRLQYYAEGEPPHTTVLDTGRSFVARDEVEDALTRIDGVASARILAEGVIKVNVSETNRLPLTGADHSLVDEIYDALGELVESANRSVLEGEETRVEARERAVQDHWPHVA